MKYLLLSGCRGCGLAAVLAICLLAIGMAGCGRMADEIGATVSVRGKVSVGGEPLALATVLFVPDAAKGNRAKHTAMGITDVEGNYQLAVFGKAGATPGWYKVVVLAFGPDGKQPAIAKKYLDAATSDLAVEVLDPPPPEGYNLKVLK